MGLGFRVFHGLVGGQWAADLLVRIDLLHLAQDAFLLGQFGFQLEALHIGDSFAISQVPCPGAE